MIRLQKLIEQSKEISEALPPHLRKAIERDKMGRVTDRTPSLKADIEITVPRNARKEALSVLKDNSIRFSTKGSGSGTFMFSKEEAAEKAASLFKKNKIKIMINGLDEAAKVIGKIDLPKEPEAKSGTVSKQELDALEKFLDNMFKSINVDIEFPRHFRDRVNDVRNKRQITVDELRSLFKKTYMKYAGKLDQVDWQAVINDVSTDINVPFVLVYDKKNKEIDLVAKTTMRKKNFKTPNTKLKV